MAHNHGGSSSSGGNEGANQDFIEQLLEMQSYAVDPTLVHFNSNNPTAGGGAFHAPPQQPPPQHLYSALGLSLDQVRVPHTFLSKFDDGGIGGGGGGGGLSHALNKRFRDDFCDSPINNNVNVFHGQPMPNHMPGAPHQPTVRPRVRARRGQATDPHSIAERLRRERIAERIRALQELVPTVNKTDRAAMLDEVVDYVKFLRLQVKVLSMSRLGGAAAVVPLVTDLPISSSVEEEGGEEGGQGQPVWEKWSNDGTESQVAKLMEENIGSAMQFLQSKALCIMPISLASAIYRTHPPDTASLVKHESNLPP